MIELGLEVWVGAVERGAGDAGEHAEALHVAFQPVGNVAAEQLCDRGLDAGLGVGLPVIGHGRRPGRCGGRSAGSARPCS